MWDRNCKHPSTELQWNRVEIGIRSCFHATNMSNVPCSPYGVYTYVAIKSPPLYCIIPYIPVRLVVYCTYTRRCQHSHSASVEQVVANRTLWTRKRQPIWTTSPTIHSTLQHHSGHSRCSVQINHHFVLLAKTIEELSRKDQWLGLSNLEQTVS